MEIGISTFAETTPDVRTLRTYSAMPSAFGRSWRKSSWRIRWD